MVEEHPTIVAARELVLHYSQQRTLDVYIDLHAHANKRGCFLFGNRYIPETESCAYTLLPNSA